MLWINMRCNEIFKDSYTQIMQLTTQELKQRFDVKFVGEEAVDEGGVSREWYFSYYQGRFLIQIMLCFRRRRMELHFSLIRNRILIQSIYSFLNLLEGLLER